MDDAARLLGVQEILRDWDREKIRRRVNNVDKMLAENIELMKIFNTEEHSVPPEGIALISQVLDREARRKLFFIHLAID